MSGVGARFKMLKAWRLAALLVAVLGPTLAGGACVQASISIDTSTLNSVSGCYKETIYGGLYETKVWTVDGSDIASTAGTKAIVADLVSEVSSIVMHCGAGICFDGVIQKDTP